MAKLLYNSELVDQSLDLLAKGKTALGSTESSLSAAVGTVTGARGAEYVNTSGLASALGMSAQVQGLIDEATTGINRRVEEIKTYNADVDNIGVGERFLSTIGFGIAKFTEGIFTAGENIVDGVASGIGFVAGIFDKNAQQSIADWIKVDHVGDAYNKLYDNELSNMVKASYMREDGIGSTVCKIVGMSVGYTLAMSAGGAALGGVKAASSGAALSSAVFKQGAIAATHSLGATMGLAFVGGTGSGTQAGLQSGLSYNKSFRRGLITGGIQAALVYGFHLVAKGIANAKAAKAAKAGGGGSSPAGSGSSGSGPSGSGPTGSGSSGTGPSGSGSTGGTGPTGTGTSGTGPTGTGTAGSGPTVDPATRIAQLKADLAAGKITHAEYAAEMLKIHPDVAGGTTSSRASSLFEDAMRMRGRGDVGWKKVLQKAIDAGYKDVPDDILREVAGTGAARDTVRKIIDQSLDDLDEGLAAAGETGGNPRVPDSKALTVVNNGGSAGSSVLKVGAESTDELISSGSSVAQRIASAGAESTDEIITHAAGGASNVPAMGSGSAPQAQLLSQPKAQGATLTTFKDSNIVREVQELLSKTPPVGETALVPVGETSLASGASTAAASAAGSSALPAGEAILSLPGAVTKGIVTPVVPAAAAAKTLQLPGAVGTGTLPAPETILQLPGAVGQATLPATEPVLALPGAVATPALPPAVVPPEPPIGPQERVIPVIPPVDPPGPEIPPVVPPVTPTPTPPVVTPTPTPPGGDPGGGGPSGGGGDTPVTPVPTPTPVEPDTIITPPSEEYPPIPYTGIQGDKGNWKDFIPAAAVGAGIGAISGIAAAAANKKKDEEEKEDK